MVPLLLQAARRKCDFSCCCTTMLKHDQGWWPYQVPSPMAYIELRYACREAEAEADRHCQKEREWIRATKERGSEGGRTRTQGPGRGTSGHWSVVTACMERWFELETWKRTKDLLFRVWDSGLGFWLNENRDLEWKFLDCFKLRIEPQPGVACMDYWSK